jgi:hypothetical protein
MLITPTMDKLNALSLTGMARALAEQIENKEVRVTPDQEREETLRHHPQDHLFSGAEPYRPTLRPCRDARPDSARHCPATFKTGTVQDRGPTRPRPPREGRPLHGRNAHHVRPSWPPVPGAFSPGSGPPRSQLPCFAASASKFS